MARRRDDLIERVIRTDFYVNEESVPPNEYYGVPPSLSVVFLHSVVRPARNASSTGLSFSPIAISPVPVHRIDPLRTVELLLRYPAYDPAWRNMETFGRPSEAGSLIFEQPVIIERSPPHAVGLAQLLHSATATSIGVLLGTQLSPDPMLMLVTIPGGIILAGAALGITKGLERGLARVVETFITGETGTHRGSAASTRRAGTRKAKKRTARRV